MAPSLSDWVADYFANLQFLLVGYLLFSAQVKGKIVNASFFELWS